MGIQAEHRQEGFTLIELLVVILIIGVLAAIALPAFLQQQAKAHDLEAKTAARTAQIVMETYFATNGDYGCDVVCVRALEPTMSSGVAATGLAVAPGVKEYTITMTQAKTGSVFRVVHRADGTVAHACDTAGSGGCPADGQW